MIEDFNIEISKADFLRLLNKGFHETAGYLCKLIEDGDHIKDVRFSRANKTYMLVCKSGREIRISGTQKEGGQSG